MNIDKQITKVRRIAISLVFLGFLIGCYGLFETICGYQGNKIWLERLALLGDFWSGTVVAFWSLAGLLFVYLGFLSQQKQIQLQETAIGKEDYKSLIEDIEKLFGDYNNILNSIVYRAGVTYERKGKDAIQKIIGKFLNYLHPKLDLPFDIKKDEYRNHIHTSLETVNNDYPMDAYFDIFSNLLSDINKLDFSNKQKYMKRLNSQLSKYERIILAFYCLTDKGSEMLSILNKWGFFKKINDSDLSGKGFYTILSTH